MPTGLIVTGVIVMVIIVVIVGLVSMLSSNYIKVPPNEAAVFVGKNSKDIVSGGAKFRIPIIHDVSYLNLTPHDLEVFSDGALDRNNVPIQVQSKALIKIGSDDTMLGTAADRFLGVPREEIDNQLRDIMPVSYTHLTLPTTPYV